MPPQWILGTGDWQLELGLVFGSRLIMQCVLVLIGPWKCCNWHWQSDSSLRLPGLCHIRAGSGPVLVTVSGAGLGGCEGWVQ